MTDETRLTDRELDAMSILWREGSGTVKEIHERFPDEVVYTTVLWLLQTLEGKGLVYREKEGRAHRYYPAIGPEVAGAGVISRLVEKVFHGSVEMLLAQIVNERQVPREELKRMRNLLNRRLAEEDER